MRSTLGSRPLSPDYETKEIKNIYVDAAGSNPIATEKDSSLNSPIVVLPLDASEISNLAEKLSPGTEVNAKSNGQLDNKSFITLSVVPQDNPVGKDSTNSGKESITFSRTKPGMLLKPAHIRRPSVNKFEVEKLSAAVESGTLSNIRSGLDSAMDLNSQTRLASEDGARKSCDKQVSNNKSVTEKSEKRLSPQRPPNQETCNESLNCNKDSNSVKFVNGVAVVPGRTRTLVERFEQRERLNSSGDPATNSTPPVVSETDKTPAKVKGETEIYKTQSVSANDGNSAGSQISRTESTSGCEGSITGSQISRRESTPTSNGIITGDQISRRELTFTPDRINTGNLTSGKEPTFTPDRIITGNQISRRESTSASNGIITGNQIARRESTCISEGIISRSQHSREATSANDRNGPNGTIIENQISRRRLNSANDGNVTIIANEILKEESISANDGNINESMMQTHDIFLSTLRSRLTKLQVVRHFWEKNDIKGAIGALRKLPDHSVQADVISVLMEKMEILTLDLFSSLLPVLMGLLDSKTERHLNVSLEMILKLVAVFGPVIHSTVSSPRSVGVDLHAEQRRECCNQCFLQLQKIQKLLSPLLRRGGAIARCAQELNLVLQE